MANQPDQFSAPGIDVVYRGDPNFAYGRSATANAQPFSNIVIHHTADDHDTDWYVNYGQTVDSERGGAFGYHFYISPDGTIVQGAPLSRRTNHILPTAEGATARNANSVGISIVGGDAGVTPAAQAAATRLGQALMTQYGIQPSGVFNHGELQPGDRGEEASNTGLVNIVSALRGTPAPAPVGPGGAPLMAYYAGSPAPLTGAAAAAAASVGAGGGDGGLPTIRNGAGNRSQPDPNVRALQEFLNANGQNLRVDGVFGDMTERAVRAYQQENGLTVDGIVGPQTWGHIAGVAAAAGGGEVSAIPGPVRGFVQRVFGDSGMTNLSARIDLFRQGISKGMSPTDAFTQARGQAVAVTPVPGSPTAMLPPKNVPPPQANPARPAAPVIPQPRANPDRLGPTQGPAMPGQVQGPVIPSATQGPVVPQEGVGPVIPPMQGPPSGPPQGPVMPSAMQGPFNDPSLMPRGAAESSVPTTPGRNIGEGEYLPLEWQQMKQLETSRSQFPTYQQAPGAVPALIPNAPPRADAYSIKPLRRTEGPTQSGNPVFDAYPDRSGVPLRAPTGALSPIIPGAQPGKQPMYEFPQAAAVLPPWGEEPGYSFMRRSGFDPVNGPPGPAAPAQFGAPAPAPIIPQARVPQTAQPNPTPYPAKPLVYDQFAGVEPPPDPPPVPEARPAFVPAVSAAKAGAAVDMRRAPPPAPVNMRVAPAKPAIPPPPVLPLVPSSTKVAVAPPPKPVIPAVVRKKAA